MTSAILVRRSARRRRPFVPSLLCAAVAVSGAVAAPWPALAAPPELARVSVSASGVSYTGTSGPDTVIVSRAGTAAAPALHFDGTAPVQLGAGCTGVAGDNTRAVCFGLNGQLPRFTLATLAGNDTVVNATTPAVRMTALLGFGDDTANGGAGIDTMHGNDGKDTLRGNGDADILTGGIGDDNLDGGPGLNDSLDGGPGADTLNGGANDLDKLKYDERTAPVSVNLLAGVGGEAGENDKIVGGFEITILGKGDDSFTGTDQRDIVFGESGADVLLGNRGVDTLNGGKGNDFLVSGPGQPLVLGSPPNRDGVVDELEGAEDTDTCLPSTIDKDLNEDCETVIPFG